MTDKQDGFLEFRCIIPVAFNAVFILTRLSFYGLLLQQLSVASLSRAVFLQCYSLLVLTVLLYFGQINDDDDNADVA